MLNKNAMCLWRMKGEEFDIEGDVMQAANEEELQKQLLDYITDEIAKALNERRDAFNALPFKAQQDITAMVIHVRDKLAENSFSLLKQKMQENNQTSGLLVLSREDILGLIDDIFKDMDDE